MGKEGSHPRNRGARVYNDAAISIPNNTWTALTFNSERFDTDGIHSITANTSRLTCLTAGKYIISGSIEWVQNSTGRRGLRILLNGVTAITIQHTPPTADGSVMCMNISTIYDLAVDEYIELQVFQVSGGALNINSSGKYSPEFVMQRLI